MPKVKLLEVKPEDVFTVAGTIPLLGGKQITKAELAVLKEEINFLGKTKVWQIITNTLSDTARKAMFEQAKTFDDMRWGKAILYAVDIQTKILEKIRQA